MKKRHTPTIRFHLLLPAAAFAVGLAIAVAAGSPSRHYSRSAEDQAELVSISERAERLQAFQRNIRKASLNTERPARFGGFIGLVDHVETGNRLTVATSDAEDLVLTVVEARKVASHLRVASPASAGMDLYLVSGRLGTTSELTQVLVGVAHPKPAEHADLPAPDRSL